MWSSGTAMSPSAADLLTVLRHLDLYDPVLIVHLEGWFDAGGSAASAMARAREASGAELVARFDTEWLLDHRANRPMMRLEDGVNTGLEWPKIEIAAGRDSKDTDILFLYGAEPDHNWRTFAAAVVGYATDQRVSRMVGLGAYPAAVPHTRPPRISTTASSSDLIKGDYSNANLDVPAGVESVLEVALAAAGIPTIGLWAQVPHYVSTTPYPASSVALIERLGDAAGLELDPGPLIERSIVARSRFDELVAAETSHQEMVVELERRMDESGAMTVRLPSGEELAAEVERFLRDQGKGI